MLNKYIIITLLFFTASVSSNSTYSDDSFNSQLVGAWELYKDDDTPNKTMSYSVINFWENGRFCIERKAPFEGVYNIDSSSITLLIQGSVRILTIKRIFELQGKVLKFKNKNIGWVYYKRISKKPMNKCGELKF